MANEVQRFAFGSIATPTAAVAGTFTLTLDGQSTNPISFDAQEGTIADELKALSNIGADNLQVSTDGSGRKILTFQGALADMNVDQVTTTSSLKQNANTVSVVTLIAGVADVDEIQIVNFGGATTGTFFLSDGFDSREVTPLDGSGVQAACDSLFGSGNTVVSGGGPFNVQFQGSNAAQNIPEMTVNSNTTDGNPFVSTFTQGVTGVSQVVSVTLPDSPTEGSCSVTIDDFGTTETGATDSSPGAIFGWTGGGSAGNWTYTRDTHAANAAVSGAEGSTPLRKSLGMETDTLTEGSAVATSNGNINLLTMGCG